MPDTEKQPIPLRDPMVHDLHIRLSRVERDHSDHNRELGVLKVEIGNVKEDTSAIRSGLNKLLWSVVLGLLGLLGSIFTFILTNGLENLFTQ